MSAAVEGDVGANKGARTNRHGAGVDEGAVVVNEDVAPYFDIGSIVNKDRSFYPGILM